jgi:hypothetical protein
MFTKEELEQLVRIIDLAQENINKETAGEEKFTGFDEIKTKIE